jgi:hypothetical protein
MTNSVIFILLCIMCVVPVMVHACPVQADESSSEVDLHVTVVGPPLVITCPANGVGTTKATLNGYLSGTGTATLVKVSFGWDTVSKAGDPEAYAHWTHPQIKCWPGKFKERIDFLKPGITYYFRAKAEGDSISYGEELSLTTHPHAYWWNHTWRDRWGRWWGRMFFWRGK